MARRRAGRPVNGMLLLDKPTGSSSNKVLQQVKRLYGAAKAGHTGALDPLATGMLPIAFGEATKFCQFLLDADKRYLATATLGVRTTTSDADGEVIACAPVPADLTVAQLQAILDRHLSGCIEQVPSMYSALKHQGQPLYKLARQGKQVEVKPRQVTIFSIRATALHGDQVDLDIHCSKGTYVRSIVEDLGMLLGCGAHVSQLRRLQAGAYQPEQMLTLDELDALARPTGPDEPLQSIQARLDGLLLPVWSAVADLPVVGLSQPQWQRVKNGQVIQLDCAPVNLTRIEHADTGEFLGIGEITQDNRLLTKRLLSTGEALG